MKTFVMLMSVVMLAIGAGSARGDDTIFAPDDQGFIHNWLLLDPIAVDGRVVVHNAAACKEYFDKPFFPGQRNGTPQDGDKVTINGSERTWRSVQSLNYFVDLVAPFAELGEPTERSVFLGVAYVTTDAEMRDVMLSIGSDDDSAWWLNGREIIRVYASRSVSKDANSSRPLTLNKGVNVLQFVVINGLGRSGASARFLDAARKPIVNLMITVKPPPQQ